MQRIGQSAFVLLFLGFAQTSLAQPLPSEDQSNYEHAMYNYFSQRPFHAIPIFLSGRRSSADTLALQGKHDFYLYSAREDCFPKLGAPQLNKRDLVKVTEIDERAMSGSGKVNVNRIADAALSANFDRVKNYSISFSNVEIDETPLFSLKQTADLSKCPFLDDVIEKTTGTGLVLVSMVILGNTEISFTLAKKTSGRADLNLLSKLLSSIKGEVNVAYDDKLETKVTITGGNQAPIAFRPAFVSSRDILLREAQVKKGLDREILRANARGDKDATVALFANFPELNARPERILRAAFLGPVVEFQPEKIQNHREYLRMMVLHYITSSAYYGRYDVKAETRQ